MSMTREEAILGMRPYTGEHVAGVDTSTLTGKVMCGYQGWFAAPGDGADLGWGHYATREGLFEPGQCTIDYWPDVSELDEDEKFPTSFRHADGSTAYVYSPYIRKSVVRHFRWMQTYGLDGVFLQRFTGATIRAATLHQRTVVTANCQAGANLHGRTWAMMYDLSGSRPGDIRNWVMEDWKLLVDRMRIREDPAYLHHDGAPVIAVWGLGFNDNRAYTLDECAELIRFLKHDPQYGGNTVMLGVPTGWRTLRRDCLPDETLHAIIDVADIVSPWSVGRYRLPQEAVHHAATYTAPDLAWCIERGKEYLPVLYPGFSWYNLMRSAKMHPGPLNDIPRLKGRFLWTQYHESVQAGVSMIFQAMFDEIDEGTAIFKCTNDAPVGESPFLTYEGLPSDHYLWLAGQGGRMLRGEIPPTEELPRRT